LNHGTKIIFKSGAFKWSQKVKEAKGAKEVKEVKEAKEAKGA
jgi:hypothetical protein